MPKPALVLLACLAAVPVVYGVCWVGTTLWYERVFLPRISGGED
jgi:hypothetical protein